MSENDTAFLATQVAPMTQEILGLGDEGDEGITEPKVEPWGRLVSLSSAFQSHDLLMEQYLLGRHESCDFVFNDPAISNNHCRIYRVFEGGSGTGSSSNSNGAHSPAQTPSSSSSSSSSSAAAAAAAPARMIVFLEDMSSNGTYVNGKKVGRGNKIILNSSDEIALAIKHKKFYMFQDLTPDEDKPSFATDCEEINEKFFLKRVLGRGATGEVRLAVQRDTGDKFAIKIIDKRKFMSDRAKASILAEGNILQSVSHPSIIRVFEMRETESFFYIILELVGGGELFDEIIKVGKFSESECKFLFIQMLLALKHLHDRNISHRDLKPENILISTIEEVFLIKISDFGLAKIVGASLMQTLCGTPNYLAPEVLLGAGQQGYDKAVDLWSLGVILFVCLCGYPPFSEEIKKYTLRDQILGAKFEFDKRYWGDISQDAMDLIRRLLVVDPKNRLDVNEALEHPWMRDVDALTRVQKLYEKAFELSPKITPSDTTGASFDASKSEVLSTIQQLLDKANGPADDTMAPPATDAAGDGKGVKRAAEQDASALKANAKKSRPSKR